MLTQKELNEWHCSACDAAGILWFHSSCHPTAPVWVSYHPDGFLRIVCSECDEHIASIAVAKGENDAMPKV